MKTLLVLIFPFILSFSAFPQEVLPTENQSHSYLYAYISIEGKIFSKKLNVEVDLGDTAEQIISGKEYSEVLTNKKSYAAILNYMIDNQYELVETLDYNLTYQGSGGTSGIVFIMRKKK